MLKQYQQIRRKQRHYIEKYQQIQRKPASSGLTAGKTSLPSSSTTSVFFTSWEKKSNWTDAKAVKWIWDLYPHNFRTNIMHLTVPFPSSPIWRRVWGSQQLDKRSQLENLPQPDQHHVDQHDSHDIVKILSMIFIVFYLINIKNRILLKYFLLFSISIK